MRILLIAPVVVSILCGFHLRAAGAGEAWIDNDELVSRTLVLADGERQKLILLEESGVLEIRPVALPRGKYLVGQNRVLGWPTAVKVGESLVCAHNRRVHHHGDPKQDDHSRPAIVLRSDDNGKTWSDAIDLRSFGITDRPLVVSGMICIGEKDGKVFVLCKDGLYRSDDQGRNWELLKGALTQDQTGSTYDGGVGPRMIIHPTRGLVVLVHVRKQPSIDIYYSTDDGNTWRHERHRLRGEGEIHPMEPTGLYHNGRLLLLSRNHILPLRGHGQIHEPQPPVMMVSDSGWFPMKHQALTNICSFRWPDTTDVAFNPVAQRFEAVVTNRSGGGPGQERNEKEQQTVNLWSISPEEFYAGKADHWRFEGTLLRLRSGMLNITPDDVDAAHPGGAVMDRENGVQHIFIYCGTYRTPTGVYRITRTLHTDKLSAAIRRVQATPP